jgi:hypothetical protein
VQWNGNDDKNDGILSISSSNLFSFARRRWNQKHKEVERLGSREEKRRAKEREGVNKEILHSRWRLPPASKEDDRFPRFFYGKHKGLGVLCVDPRKLMLMFS